MKKWVVLSCTTNSIYDFFLPIAARLWRRRIGYEPVVVLVGHLEDWKNGHSKVVHEEVSASQFRVETLLGISRIPDSLVSMGLRQNVSALNFEPDDVLLVGDVDLFPVHAESYHRYDSSRSPVGVYYADMYGDRYWPAYGISMPIRNWREVMGVEIGGFRESVERMFSQENLKAVGLWDGLNGWDSRFWTFDERYASYKIKTSRFAKDVALFPSDVDGKKPQRAKLPENPDVSKYVDFHCSRPGWNGENWPDIRHALSQMIPEDLAWLDNYVERYRAAL
jgi:hypothetical protein